MHKDSWVLDQIRSLLMSGNDRVAKARRVAELVGRSGGHYPLEIKLTSQSGELLLEVACKNVWDRKSTFTVEDKEWNVPINFDVREHGKLYSTEVLEEVAVRTDFVVQQDFGEIFADEKT